MAERQVTVDGVTRELPYPFLAARDREPDRVRGHVPAAGGAARPLLPPHGARLSGLEDELRILAEQRYAHPLDGARAGRRPRRGPRAPRGRAARVRRRRAPPLGRRARACDARAGVGRHRELGARQPRARARRPRVGAARRPQLRRARGHRAAVRRRCSSIASSSRPASSPVRARPAGRRRSRSSAQSCLELAPQPGSEEDPLFEGGVRPVEPDAERSRRRAGRVD